MRDDKPITWSKSLRSRGETMVLQLGAVQFEHLLRRDIVLQDKVLQAVQMVEEYRNTKAIQSIWPFALCSQSELEELLRCFECETMHAQTRLFDARASNPCRAVYYVLSGELRVTQLVPGPDGKPTVVRTCKPCPASPWSSPSAALFYPPHRVLLQPPHRAPLTRRLG
jgi:hypothetical protein